MTRMSSVLAFENLSIDFETPTGPVHAVRNVNFEVPDNKVVGIVGESGCGKTTVISAAMSLLSNNAVVASGRVSFEQQDILKLSEAALRKIRGEKISMVFQDPMTSQNPVISIGKQMIDIQYRQTEFSLKQKRSNAVDMLNRVGIPDPEMRLNQFPHELSGGMRQRAMIAMALSCQPRLLIADEPTTALDVTTQANILDLIRELQKDMDMTIIFITHDLGVVAEIADEVVVMYLGKAVESGDVDTIFHDPKHPYTRELLQSIPKLGSSDRGRLQPIPGMVPHPFARPKGCDFHPRCESFLQDTCDQIEPSAIRLSENSHVRCLLYGGAEKEQSTRIHSE